MPLNGLSQWLGHANVQVAPGIYVLIVGSDYEMDDVP